MTISRRRFLTAIVGSGAVIRSGVSALKPDSIGRESLVRRHNPVLRQLDPLSPLSLGNGEFAFTADITGLQTLAQSYENAMPLCTMSQWGWHTTPLPNGHNWQRPNLPCYLPGNGGLLYAVAMMTGGWRGSPRGHAPGFPDDGSWTVRSEGLNTALMGQL